MSSAEQPDEPRVRVLPPDEALHRGHTLPTQAKVQLDDVSDTDWEKFWAALAET